MKLKQIKEKMNYRLYIIKSTTIFTHGIRHLYIFMFLLSLMTISLSFFSPIIYRIFIDDVLVSKKINLLIWVICGYLALHFIQIIFEYFKLYLSNRINNHMNFKIKFKLFNHLFYRDFNYYESLNIGDLKMRIEDDVNCVTSMTISQTINYIVNVLTLIISIIFLLFICWQLTIISILFIPLTFFLDHILSKKEWKTNEANRENDQQFNSWLRISVQNWKEVKSLNLQKYEKMKYTKFIHRHAINMSKWHCYATSRNLVLPKIRDDFLMKIVLYFVGGYLIWNGNLSIGTLLVFAQYFSMMYSALKSISALGADLQSNRAASDRFLLEYQELKKLKKNTLNPAINCIEFLLDNVSFYYANNPDNLVINNLSFVVKQGDRIGIIGKSGCGKTTLLKLLTGEVRPTVGNVFFSGNNIQDINLSILYKQIGYITQEPFIMNETIRENLRYGKTKASDAELLKACKMAYIDDFINSLPDGLDTIIGERGVRISGGQKQRLVLARMFLKDPSVYIFDEATSSLDQHNEQLIQKIIGDLGNDKTIIIVSHRKSSLSLCTNLIIMN